MKVIVVEGNIACGKSTLIKSVQKKMLELHDVQFLVEPLEAYENYKTFKPLELLYENPQKNGYFAQAHIIETLTKHIYCALEYAEPAVLVTERTLQSARLFVSVLYKLGYIADHEKEKLLDSINRGIDKCPRNKLMVDKVFFINIPTEVCYKRIQERGRKGEECISLQYLRELETEYILNIKSFSNTHRSADLEIVEYNDEFLEQRLIDFINEE